MAENNDDKQPTAKDFGSFKERILAELQEATRIRQEREEAACQARLLEKEKGEPSAPSTEINQTDEPQLVVSESEPAETALPDQAVWNMQEELAKAEVQQNSSLSEAMTEQLTLEQEVTIPDSENLAALMQDDLESAESDSTSLSSDSLLDVTAGREEVSQVLDNLEKVFTPEPLTEVTSASVSKTKETEEKVVESKDQQAVLKDGSSSDEQPDTTIVDTTASTDATPTTEAGQKDLAQSVDFTPILEEQADTVEEMVEPASEDVSQPSDLATFNLSDVVNAEADTTKDNSDLDQTAKDLVADILSERIASQHVSDELEVDKDSSSAIVTTEKENPSAKQHLDDNLEDPMALGRKKVKEKRQRRDSLAKKLALYIISVVVVLLLVIGGFGAYYVSSSLGAVDSKSTSYVQVEIPAGSGTKMIGQILEKNGLIKSATIFNYYSKFKNYSHYQSGYFNLQKSMTLDEIAKSLQSEGTAQPTQPVLGKVLVKEGYTIEQIAKAIEVNSNSKKSAKTPYSSTEFLKLMKDEAFIKEMVNKYPKLLANLPAANEAVYQLEGYLFPATYDYYQGTSLKDLVDSMLATMNTKLSSYYDTIAKKNMTVNEVLTLASLVEKEGQTDDDRRMIASVFYNRLNAGQALQSNIAVLYALGKLGQATTLSEDANIDTSVNSPYNDYTHTGLMPGPVDSAGLSAIEAAVNPASTNYYYFVADVKTGKVYYAKDYETHQKNVEKYINSQLSSASSSS